jgi:hypothetical protein
MWSTIGMPGAEQHGVHGPLAVGDRVDVQAVDAGYGARLSSRERYSHTIGPGSPG